MLKQEREGVMLSWTSVKIGTGRSDIGVGRGEEKKGETNEGLCIKKGKGW